MQIPYDLEFVENRSTVPGRSQGHAQAHAATLRDPYGAWPKESKEDDVFDALLRWLHGKIAKLEKH
jgi:hypothetical protein